MRHSYFPDPIPIMMDILLLLVRNGADVDATDNDNVSISMLAYSNQNEASGNHRGDILDRALVECGYNLLERRKDFPRRPIYSRWYTREEFEEIWEGWESHCPYYDEPPEWDPKEIEANYADEVEHCGLDMSERIKFNDEVEGGDEIELYNDSKDPSNCLYGIMEHFQHLPVVLDIEPRSLELSSPDQASFSYNQANWADDSETIAPHLTPLDWTAWLELSMFPAYDGTWDSQVAITEASVEPNPWLEPDA